MANIVSGFMNSRGPLSRAPISVIQELQSHPEAGMQLLVLKAFSTALVLFVWHWVLSMHVVLLVCLGMYKTLMRYSLAEFQINSHLQ